MNTLGLLFIIATLIVALLVAVDSGVGYKNKGDDALQGACGCLIIACVVAICICVAQIMRVNA